MGRKSMLRQRQLSRKLSEVGLCYGIKLGADVVEVCGLTCLDIERFGNTSDDRLSVDFGDSLVEKAKHV